MLHLYILRHQLKHLRPGVGYSLLSLPHGPPRNCQLSQAIVTSICTSLKSDGKALLLETIFTYSFENGEVSYPLKVALHTTRGDK